MAKVLAQRAVVLRQILAHAHGNGRAVQRFSRRLPWTNGRLFSTCSKSSSAASSAASAADNEQFWVRSVEPEIHVPSTMTVMEMVWDSVVTYGNATYIECGVTGRKYTFSELYRYSRGLGAALMKLGLQRNDIVGLVMQNLPEFPICLFGALDAGMTVSPVNPMYTSEEIRRQLLLADASCVICSEHFAPSVIEASQGHGKIKSIIVVGKAPEGCLAFHDLIKTDPTGHDFLRGDEIQNTEHMALLPFSSGTTGPPKGVVLTHANLLANVLQYSQEEITVVRPLNTRGQQDKLVGILPFFHAFGSSSIVFLGALQGAHTMTLPNFTPQTFTKALKSHKPTVLHLVTPIISFMNQYPDIVTEDFESVESVLAAAAPIGQEIINQLITKAKKSIFFQEAYGMTELSPASHAIPWRTGNSKIGSCGVALSSEICKIVDTDSGRAVGMNQRGELCIRGPNVMKGYYKNEKATKETIDDEGWLHTGDIAYYDEDNHFYIVDRLKELIKVKGFQVAPSELEGLLRDHKDVVDVAVIGVPNEESGELPRAYIVKGNQDLSEKDINLYMSTKVAPFKQLRGGIEFVDSIPKAASGKILRRELLLAYKNQAGLA